MSARSVPKVFRKLYSSLQFSGPAGFGSVCSEFCLYGIAGLKCDGPSPMDFRHSSSPGAENSGIVPSVKAEGSLWSMEVYPQAVFNQSVRRFRISVCPPGNNLISKGPFPEDSLLDSCALCSKQTYLLQPTSSNRLTCHPCPIGAVCDGGNSVVAQSGFWRDIQGEFAATHGNSENSNSSEPHSNSENANISEPHNNSEIANISEPHGNSDKANISEPGRRRSADPSQNSPALVYPCPPGACEAGNVCKDNRMGPVCGLCKPGYILTAGGCSDCRNADLQKHKLIAAIIFFVLVTALISGECLAWGESFETDEIKFSVADISASESVSEWSELEEKIKNAIKEYEALNGSWLNDAKTLNLKSLVKRTFRAVKQLLEGSNFHGKIVRELLKGIMRKWKELAFSQYIKIYITFFQILSSFSAYPIPWHPKLSNMMVWCKGIFQLDIFSLPNVSCIWLEIGFADKLLLYTLAPIIVLLLLYLPLALNLIVNCIQGTGRQENVSEDSNVKNAASKTEQRQLKAKALERRFYKNFMFWLFFIYPQASVISLQAFDCRPFGLERLAADYSRPCPGSSLTDLSHWTRKYSTFFAIFYIFGTPFLMLITMLWMGVNSMAQMKLDNSVVQAMISSFSSARIRHEEERTLIKQLGINNLFNCSALDRTVETALNSHLKGLIEYYKKTHTMEQDQPFHPSLIYSNFPNADNLVRVLEEHDNDRDGNFTDEEFKNLSRYFLNQTGGFGGWEDLNTFRYECDQVLLMTLCTDDDSESRILGYSWSSQTASVLNLKQMLSSLYIGQDFQHPQVGNELRHVAFTWPDTKEEVFVEKNRHFVENECSNILTKRANYIFQLKSLLGNQTYQERHEEDESYSQSNDSNCGNCFSFLNSIGEKDETKLENLRKDLKDAVKGWLRLNCNWLWYCSSFWGFLFHFHIEWLCGLKCNIFVCQWLRNLRFAAPAYSICRRLRDESRRLLERQNEVFHVDGQRTFDPASVDKMIVSKGFAGVFELEVLKQIVIEKGKNLVNKNQISVSEPEWSREEPELKEMEDKKMMITFKDASSAVCGELMGFFHTWKSGRPSMYHVKNLYKDDSVLQTPFCCELQIKLITFTNFWLRIKLEVEPCIRILFFTVESDANYLKHVDKIFPNSAYADTAKSILRDLKMIIWQDFKQDLKTFLNGIGYYDGSEQNQNQVHSVLNTHMNIQGSKKYNHKETLRNEEILVVEKIGILFLSYKVKYWFWEIFEMLRRFDQLVLETFLCHLQFETYLFKTFVCCLLIVAVACRRN
jgi:hypothetical protein